MKTICQWEIKEINGKIHQRGTTEREYEDPVFLNMQFCMERNQYEELLKICKEYKLTGVHQAIQGMLNNEDPYKFVEQYM